VNRKLNSQTHSQNIFIKRVVNQINFQ
jgi:hypothetical protein